MSAVQLCIVFLLAISGCKGQQLRSSVLEKIPGLDDVKFISDLLFESTVTSDVECGHHCGRIRECCTFTFTQLTMTSGTCRGHSLFMTSSSPQVLAPGSTAFRSNRVLKDVPCTSVAECFAVNAECYLGRCLCIQGYYYSVSTELCVRECKKADLQTTYMMYPHSWLKDGNIASYWFDTADKCKQACNANSRCLTVDYRTDRVCYLQDRTALTTALHRNDPSTDNYQKHCA